MITIDFWIQCNSFIILLIWLKICRTNFFLFCKTKCAHSENGARLSATDRYWEHYFFNPDITLHYIKVYFVSLHYIMVLLIYIYIYKCIYYIYMSYILYIYVMYIFICKFLIFSANNPSIIFHFQEVSLFIKDKSRLVCTFWSILKGVTIRSNDQVITTVFISEHLAKVFSTISLIKRLSFWHKICLMSCGEIKLSSKN